MTAPQHTPAQTRVECLPTYILIDVSQSMQPVEQVLNDTVESLINELILHPAISDFAYITLMTFSTDAHVVVQGTDIQNLTEVPELACDGVTNFGRAFQLVRDCIDRDVDLLRDADRQVLRPVVFLLTDGQPTDEEGYLSDAWRADFARLVDPEWRRRPNVVPFGFGEATKQDISDMSTRPGAAFLAKDDDSVNALREIFATLLRTLVASARSNALEVPAEISGFVSVNRDVD